MAGLSQSERIHRHPDAIVSYGHRPMEDDLRTQMWDNCDAESLG